MDNGGNGMAKATPGEELDVATSSVELEAVRAALLGEGRLQVPDEDPDVVTARIVGRILDADSMEKTFAPSSVIKGDDFVNVPFTIEAVTWLSSDYEEGGPGVFALADGVCRGNTVEASAGDIVKVSLGGAQVIAQLYKAVANGWLPLDVVIRKTEKATKRGFHPKWLELPKDAKATSAKAAGS
jgi:hypothetical protein